MDGIEINEKYVRAFKFGTWPNGKPRWVIGRWELGDSMVEYLYPKNFNTKKEAQAFMAKLNLKTKK
jgi:hypothetical protein